MWKRDREIKEVKKESVRENNEQTKHQIICEIVDRRAEYSTSKCYFHQSLSFRDYKFANKLQC